MLSVVKTGYMNGDTFQTLRPSAALPLTVLQRPPILPSLFASESAPPPPPAPRCVCSIGLLRQFRPKVKQGTCLAWMCLQPA